MELIKNYNLTGTIVVAKDAGDREVYAHFPPSSPSQFSPTTQPFRNSFH